MNGGPAFPTIDRLRRLRPSDVVRRRDEFMHRTRSAAAQRLPAKLAVLNYHRIGAAIADPWELTVSAANFEQQLRKFNDEGDVVPLENELRRARSSRATGTRRVAITFDDGYADTLEVALPIMERHDVPATVFISTGFVDQPTFWWERVAELTIDSFAEIGDVAEVAMSMGILAPTWSADAIAPTRDDLHLAVYDQIAPMGRADIDAILLRFAERIGNTTPSASRPVTTDELVTLAAHPLVTIGAHTVSHPKLPTLSNSDALAEIVDGQNELDRVLGPCERLLAYPHGEATRATAKLAKRAGFSSAVTTEDRWVSPLDHPLRIPRVHATDRVDDDLESSFARS